MKGQDLLRAIELAKSAAKELSADIQVCRANMDPVAYAHYADTLHNELFKISKELHHDVKAASRKKLL